MSLPRQAFGCHQWCVKSYRNPWFALSNLRLTSTYINARVDFLGVEQKWQAKWDSQRNKIQEKRDTFYQHDPIVPFFVGHIRQQTIMGTLQSIMCSTKRATATDDSKTSMIEQVLSTYDWTPSDYSRDNLVAYSHRYGTDVVRTCIIFSQDTDADQDTDRYPLIREKSLIRAQEWFGSVWDAVRVAHLLYQDTQAHASLVPPDPETHDDPHITEKIIDDDLDLIGSLVHVAPARPSLPNIEGDEDACALWLASQEAILSMTNKTKSVDPHGVRSRLSSLIYLIINYVGDDGPRRIEPSVHYHSTRILLSLIAPFAPSFAEECWLALHYGKDHWRYEEGYGEQRGETDSGPADDESLIREDLIELGYEDLPRREDPDTLSSIFAQPFPIAEPTEVIELLKRRAAKSILRLSARREAKNDSRRWKESLTEDSE